MIVARPLLLTLLAVSLAGHTAKAEIFDHLSVSAVPSDYDGPCPVSIKLESVIKFEVSFNTQEKFVYRWESGDETLTDNVFTVSKGRSNHVETTISLSGPVGRTFTTPIRLHAAWGTDFSKTTAYSGKAVNDHYSLPTNVSVTCR